MVWFLILIVFLLDQVTKIGVSSVLHNGESIGLGSFLSITLVRNPGAAFGIFQNSTVFFILVSVVSVILIFMMIKKSSYTYFQKSALGLILAGALGNLLDRVRFGYVIDFIDLKIWPVFNVADTAITIGAILLVFTIIKKPHVSNII